MNIKTGDLCVPAANCAVTYIDPTEYFPTKIFARSNDILVFIGLSSNKIKSQLAVFVLSDGSLVSLYDGEYKQL